MNKRLFILIFTLLFALLGLLPAAAQNASGEAFPITIEHKFGSTTITKAPERVVSIGFSDQDPLLALGVKPVAVRYWYGDKSNQIFPWAQDEADGAEAVVLDMAFGTLSYEAILELQPDLISAVYSGITEEEYEALSQIAPTIAQSADYIDFGMPWQETTKLIGAALGKSEEAQALVSETEAQLLDAREQNPEFAGKSVAVVYAYSPGAYGYYTAQDPRGRFFTDLGFVIPEDLIEIAGDSYYADLSPERIDLLDRDLIVVVGLQFVEGGREAIESDPLLSKLKAVQEGRVLYVPNEIDDALQYNTILSLPYLLGGILPELQTIFGSQSNVQTSTECEPGFRLFESEQLTTDPVCIPENPQRIAAVDTFTLETLLALGIKPVSGPFLETFLRDHQQFTEQLADVTEIGWPVNPEALVAAHPDLIISIEPWIKDISSEISEIAPTVSIRYDSDGAWQDIARAVGNAVNQTEALDTVFDDYENRLQAFKDLTAANSVGDISIVFLVPDGLLPFVGDTFSGSILLESGLIFPTKLTEGVADDPFSDISQERLDLLDSSDHIFVVTSGFTDEDLATYQELIAKLEANPLWQSLPAVQAGHVHIVGRDWIGSSLIAANTVIDDLFRDIEAVEPQEVSVNPFISAEATPEVPN